MIEKCEAEFVQPGDTVVFTNKVVDRVETFEDQSTIIYKDGTSSVHHIYSELSIICGA